MAINRIGRMLTVTSPSGTKYALSPESTKGRKPLHCRRSGLNIGSLLITRPDSVPSCIVGVTQSAPTEVARTPADYAEKLASFAAERSRALGVTFTPHSEIGHDVAIDLEAVLERVAEAIDAELIVMASHVPGFAEHFFASNAGYLASHASMSVLVVR